LDNRFSVPLTTILAFAPAGIIWAFLPVHLYSLKASYTLIALVSLIPAVETILFSPLWGGLLDRTRNGRWIILVSLLAETLGFASFPFLSSPVDFVLVVAVMGIFTSSFIPIFSALATWASGQYGRAIGGFWIAASLGYGASTLLGGIVYQFYGANYLFTMGALFGLAGCGSMILLTWQSLASTVPLQTSRGYTGLLRQRDILALCTISILAIIATSAFNSFFTVYLVDSLGTSTLLAGLAASGTTLLGALAFKFIGPLNDRIGRKPVFMMGTIGYSLYFLTIYFITSSLIVTILWVLPIYPLVQSSAAAFASDYTSSADRGKGLGLLEAAISLGGGLGPLAGGLIADRLGLKSVTLFSLAMALAATLASSVFLKEKLAMQKTTAAVSRIRTVFRRTS
jgi:MFS family permease